MLDSAGRAAGRRGERAAAQLDSARACRLSGGRPACRAVKSGASQYSHAAREGDVEDGSNVVVTREPQRDACTDHDTTRPPAGERPGWRYRAATMNWDLRHRKSSLVIRLLLAVWITAVVIVLCATGRWWGLAFVAPLILDLYLLRRILVAGSGS